MMINRRIDKLWSIHSIKFYRKVEMNEIDLCQDGNIHKHEDDEKKKLQAKKFKTIPLCKVLNRKKQY
jgi:hypothetical protein